MIHMLIHDPEKAQNSVNAPAQAREKDRFWEHLLQFNHVIDVPWCLMGDFNKLASPNEKRRG